MDIGKKLKDSRLRSGLTQEAVAQSIGVTRQSISNWENGRSYPDIGSILRLSDLYGITLDALLKENQVQARQQVHFLEAYWDLIYNTAVTMFPIAILLNHFVSQAAAMAAIFLGGALFVLPRLIFAKIFGGGLKNVALGILGWGLLIAATLLRLAEGYIPFWTLSLQIAGMVLVIFIRHREYGPRKKAHWIFPAIILATPLIIWLSGALDDGDFSEANPFLHPYRVAEVVYTVDNTADVPMVELGYENELRFLQRHSYQWEGVGRFVYVEPAEGEQAETVLGIWQLVPENAGTDLYRLTVEADGSIFLSWLQADILQWRWRLERVDTFRWTVANSGSVASGTLEWFLSGTFDGQLQYLDCPAVYGEGTLSIIPEETPESLTIYEEYYSHEGAEPECRELTLTPNDSGGFQISVAVRYEGDGQYAIYRIPYQDGEFILGVQYK